jgi:hypothetical protein
MSADKGGYGRPALDEDKVFDDLNTYRWVNLIFHLVRLIVAVATFAICAWIRFDLDFRVWVEQIDWYTYWYCMYVIWIAMSAEIIVSSLGAFAVLKVSCLVNSSTANNMMQSCTCSELYTLRIRKCYRGYFTVYYRLLPTCRTVAARCSSA